MRVQVAGQEYSVEFDYNDLTKAVTARVSPILGYEEIEVKGKTVKKARLGPPAGQGYAKCYFRDQYQTTLGRRVALERAVQGIWPSGNDQPETFRQGRRVLRGEFWSQIWQKVRRP